MQASQPLQVPSPSAPETPEVHTRLYIEYRFSTSVPNVNMNGMMFVTLEKEAVPVFFKDSRRVSKIRLCEDWQPEKSNKNVSDGSQPSLRSEFHSERNGWLPFDGPSGSSVSESPANPNGQTPLGY